MNSSKGFATKRETLSACVTANVLGASSPNTTVRNVMITVAAITPPFSPRSPIAAAVPSDVARTVKRLPESITALKSLSCCFSIRSRALAFLFPLSMRWRSLNLLTAIIEDSELESTAIATSETKIRIKSIILGGSIR